MKVKFEFSAADLAEVSNRTVDRSPMIRKWRRTGRWALSLLAGLVVFIAAPGEIGARAAVAMLVGIVLLAWLTWRQQRRKAKPRLVDFYREQLGGDGPFTCEIEIDETGVTTRQFGSETRRPWSQVASVSEAPGGIELVYRPMGTVLVRDRAFADSQGRAEFLALARSFLARPQSATG
jgi:hypothetical protein